VSSVEIDLLLQCPLRRRVKMVIKPCAASLVVFLAAWAPVSAGPPDGANSGIPSLFIASPSPNRSVKLGDDTEKSVKVVVVASNFVIRPAGQCGANQNCGHLHLKIDPTGDTCNIPGRNYNSMNSDTGTDVVMAHFAHCPNPSGLHTIGILLAHDNHTPVIVEGKPVTAAVSINTE
jgi:hypothetical protein